VFDETGLPAGSAVIEDVGFLKIQRKCQCSDSKDFDNIDVQSALLK
jgi:hypothetical protein